MKQRCYNTLTFGLGCLLIIGGLSVRGQQRPGKPKADTPRLQLNQPQTREIKAGETRSYHIALQAGEFVQVEAMQQGVDVVLTLLAPNGKELARRDSPNNANGPESLSYVATVTGVYRVSVSVWAEAEVRAGKYSIALKAVRQPSSKDRRRIEEEMLFQAAVDLENQRRALAAEKKDEEAKTKRQESVEKYKASIALWRKLGEKYWLVEVSGNTTPLLVKQ